MRNASVNYCNVSYKEVRDMSKMLTKSKGKEVLPMGRVQKSRKASWKRWLCPGLFCQRQTAEAQNSS